MLHDLANPNKDHDDHVMVDARNCHVCLKHHNKILNHEGGKEQGCDQFR